MKDNSVKVTVSNPQPGMTLKVTFGDEASPVRPVEWTDEEKAAIRREAQRRMAAGEGEGLEKLGR